MVMNHRKPILTALLSVCTTANLRLENFTNNWERIRAGAYFLHFEIRIVTFILCVLLQFELLNAEVSHVSLQITMF